jgi:PHD/YefM family antitoxin component YafN of YafNO toxin-antitoxin module
MVAYSRSEIISVTDLARNLSSALGSVIDYSLDKLAISKNNKLEAVIVSIDEYERMKEAYEYMEDLEIARIIEERSKTPTKKYLTLEELAKSVGFDLNEL